MLAPSIFNRNFMDDFFDDMFTAPFDNGFNFGVQNPSRMTMMSADIQEFDDKYELDMELPGFNKEDIQATCQDGYLTIQADHAEDKDEKDENGKYIRKERYSGHCQRSFYVGNAITQEDLKAKFENGVLKIDIPKKEETKEVDQKHYISIEG